MLKTGDEGEIAPPDCASCHTNDIKAIGSPPSCCWLPLPPLPPARPPSPAPASLLRPTASPCLSLTPDVEELSQEYTDVMQQRMGSATLTYRHEDGMNYRC